MSSPRLQPKARRLEVEGKTIYVPWSYPGLVDI